MPPQNVTSGNTPNSMIWDGLYILLTFSPVFYKEAALGSRKLTRGLSGLQRKDLKP